MEEIENTENQESQVVQSIFADENGNWQFDLSADVEPGTHTVLLQDEFGNSDLFFLQVEEKEMEEISNECFSVENNVVQDFSYWLIALAFLGGIVFMSLVMFVLKGKKRSKRSRKVSFGFDKRYIVYVLLVLLVLSGIYFLYRGDHFVKESSDSMENVSIERQFDLDEVFGQVFDPLTKLEVSGVSLKVADVSVLLDGTSNFRFNVIPEDALGVEIRFDGLNKPFLKMFEESSKMDIYFAVDFYNTILNVVNLEASDRYENIYEYLGVYLKAKISKDEFIQGYEDGFEVSNLSDDFVYIVQMKKVDSYKSSYDLTFDNVWEVTLFVNGEDEEYYFVYEEGGWRFLGK